MEVLDFGPYQTLPLGTPKKDKQYVEGGFGFYAGAGNDVLTNGSYQIESESALGGISTIPSILSGGLGNDTYDLLTDQEWGFIADAGGGKDIIRFGMGKFSDLNPKSKSLNSVVSTILINDRDVMIATTNLDTGVRDFGVIFSDPFGTLVPENKLEKVKFGKKKYSFKKFVKSLAKKAESSELYSYDAATFSDLGDAGLLNLTGFPDTNVLDSGEYIQIALINNSLVV